MNLIKGNNVNVLASQIFLIPGKIGEGSAAIEHRVVVAHDEIIAFDLLKNKEPNFIALGITSLKEYQDTVKKIRLSINDNGDGWPRFVEESFINK